MIVADTSVWIDHLRNSDPALAAQLAMGNILMHPMVMGELACGNIANRDRQMDDWRSLPVLEEAPHEDVLVLIESRGLMGRGMGFIDAHLLCAALRRNVPLWTKDVRLRQVTVECGVAFQETP